MCCEGGDNCKITVITACLNAVTTIEQTILSVLQQSYSALEYIIIDGASTDGTLDIINKYAKSFQHIVSEPDGGIFSAFNKGLKRATGEIICILNADDLYAPWTFEAIADAYRSSPDADAFYAGCMLLINDENRRWTIRQSGNPAELRKDMSLFHPAVFIKKDAYNRWGFYDESYSIAGDWDLLLRLYLEGAVFYRMKTLTTGFRLNGHSALLTKHHQIERIKVLHNLPISEAIRLITRECHRFYGVPIMKKLRIWGLYLSFRKKHTKYSPVETITGEYPADMSVADIWDYLKSRGVF